MAEQLIKGMILKSRLNYLVARFGLDAISKVLPFMKGRSKETMADHKNIRATGWYPFSVNKELDMAIFLAFGKGDERIYKDMGGFSNEFQESVSSMDLFSSPWKFLRLQTNAFPRFWKPGRLELVEVRTSGDCEAIMKFHEVRSCRTNCMTNIGFLEKGLELCGAKDIKVWETKCTEDPKVAFCEMHMTFKWSPKTP